VSGAWGGGESVMASRETRIARSLRSKGKGGGVLRACLEETGMGSLGAADVASGQRNDTIFTSHVNALAQNSRV
jgi:hypothetical protein